MWTSSSSASRACWRAPLLAFTTRRAAQCSFSTAPITQVSYYATERVKKMDEGVAKYGRWTKDALIKRIQKLEKELSTKDQNESPSGVATTETGISATSAAAPPSDEGYIIVPKDTDTTAEDGPRKKKAKKESGALDPSKYTTRLVALKLAYLGKNYGGFEYQVSTKVPTIEEELWKALVKACLIFPENPDEVDFDPMEYAKCGRTDRGVSAFGQVISIRLRSNRPLPKKPEEETSTVTKSGGNGDGETTAAPENGAKSAEEVPEEKAPKREFDDYADELSYSRILNRLLPPDIRILAWCPSTPAEFSARHHCRERQYRYFFTQPAYSPMPSHMEDPKTRDGKRPKDGWLDIEAMRDAARRFEGLHDFRNFCKIDSSKAQQSFVRRMFESTIVEVPDAESALPFLQREGFQPLSSSGADELLGPRGTTASPPSPPPPEGFPKVYYFHVRGSAFLWHQIRCMVSILFTVGQGLESPEIIDKLLDITTEPRRPEYNLAAETPLVLWDCLFPADLDSSDRTDALDWVYVGEDDPRNAHGASGLVDHFWSVWRERKLDELLAGQLIGLVATKPDLALRRDPKAPLYGYVGNKVFEGDNRVRSAGKYVPLLKRMRLATPQEAYDKEARRKGFEDAKHMLEVVAQRRAEAWAEREREKAAGAGDEMVE
ncbi:pseudouridine synthase [Astrocystis sublimbata]|nr:pseudouridine synthase [Astrocystis sublimbata]